MPVGFKNGTRGDIKMAADAVLSASYPHCFMGITGEGKAAICNTKGNKNCHIILRGGKEGPNYFSRNVSQAHQILRNAGVNETLMIDCSHGNSGKDYTQQYGVFMNVMRQAKDNPNIIGIMMESNIHEGKQKLIEGKKPAYGISITDSCINFEDTEKYILEAHALLPPPEKN